ncbi:DUF3566 domain-containing protein [Natronosporangium hydrolyticum]|uniref:DUF3566 domain-containing protein n=1 Tax=Natronosporangium hydrolyticum TaxID=2811111 RepID=UPI001EFA0761|nr:DUF3566 domain-containing protein [Natronosporangium hydrolyticum]
MAGSGSGPGAGAAGAGVGAGAAASGDGGGEPAKVDHQPEPKDSGGGAEPSAKPSFTRPPGMVPPPDRIEDVTHPSGWSAATPVSGAPASGPPAAVPFSGAASAPVSAPPRVTGRQAAPNAVTMRPGSGGDSVAGAGPIGEPIRPRAAATPRGPRRARLHLKRVDPWSVMKFSFAVSLVLFIVVIVASSVLYLALDAMGVFASVNETVAELISGAGETGNTFRITAQGVIGTAAVLGALNVLLFTSLATLGAFIYNVCADLVGGVEVTLAERD